MTRRTRHIAQGEQPNVSAHRRPNGHDTREEREVTARKWFGRTSILVGVLVAAIAVTGSASAGKQAGNPYGLKKPGTLTVGMTLQFKPEMYLDANGKPAGYDVVLLKALAKQWHVKLDIKNLDFNGLIPGLVAKKFDMVSVGLSATPERKKSINFSRAYVPYAQILAAAKSDTTPATIDAWNTSSKTITSLQGSTAEQLVQKTFPNATSHSFPDQNAAFLEVSSGRASGIVVENYLLAQFNKSNGNVLKEVAFPKPLHVEYGSYGVQKGNTKLANALSKFICGQQKSGALGRAYQSTIGAPLPAMPACK
jgi:ABC-type amino acid transport substrate-binding protein